MKTRLIRLLALATVGVGLLPFAATGRTLTVNPDASAGADYTTLATAFAEAQDGDTISCAAGVYSNGYKNASETGNISRRALLKGRSNVTIVGAGRGQSVVLGGERVLGSGQVAGFELYGCTNVTVSGFTFSRCYGWNDRDSIHSQGAGFLSVYGKDNVVADCSFDDCKCYQGGAIAAFVKAADVPADGDGSLSAVRCLFEKMEGAYNCDGIVGWNVKLYYCVMAHVHAMPSGSSWPVVFVGVTAVNCTFAENRIHTFLKKAKAYNCAFGDKANRIGGGSVSVYGCRCSISSADANVDGDNTATLYGQDDFQFKNMFLDDFRPVAHAVSVGVADTSYLNLIPEAYRLTDFYGKTIDAAGLVNVGAAASAQSVVTPTGHYFWFVPHADDTQIVINGKTNDFRFAEFGRNSWSNQTRFYFYPDYPSFVRIKVISPDEDREWGFVTSGGDSVVRYPDAVGDYAFMSRPYSLNSGMDLVHALAAADPVMVDGATYPTVQAAVDAVADGAYGIVRVPAGTYAAGGRKLTSVDIDSRVVVSGRKVRIIGAGADKTFICGAADLTAEAGHHGCGSAAVRCLATDSVGQLVGVTLTGGRTARGSGANLVTDAANFGAAVYARAVFELADCVVSNNAAARSAIVGADLNNRVVLKRCRISDNVFVYAYHWAQYIASASCLWANNWAAPAAGNGRDGSVWGGYNSDDGGYIYDSTFYAPASAQEDGAMNFQGYVGGWDNTKAKCRNCLIVGSGKVAYLTCHGTVVERVIPNCTKTTHATDLTGGISGKNILAFMDAASGDFRLLGDSEGVTNAVWRADDGASMAYVYTTSSLDGVWPDFTGAPQPSGCYRKVPLAVVKVPADVSAVPAYLRAGESTTLTITNTPFLHFTVNGVAQPQTPGTYSLVFTRPSDETKGVFTVGVVKDTNWYVDAVNGTDDGYGTVAAPLRTLVSACSRAVSGDTVHVAPGAYDEGEMAPGKLFWNEASSTLNARVTVKPGVSVEATGAAAETFIVGQAAPDAEKGLGAGALRCAVVLSGGKLKGFTLKDGHTTMSYNGNGCGAGMIGDGDGLVEDCVFTNCVGYIGAGHWGGSFNRCTFVGCDATKGNSVVGRFGRYRNCYFENNVGGIPLYGAYEIESCTVGKNNATIYGTHDGDIEAFSGTRIANTLFLGKKISVSTNVVFKNCYLPTDVTIAKYSAASETQSWTLDDDCRTLSRADLAVDATGHPVFGTNPAVDGGKTALYDAVAFGGRDCDGNPRILNDNRIDVGCFEYDWRPKFAAKLGRRVTVTDAGAAVRLTDAGVELPAEATLSLSVATTADESYVFDAVVADGELSVEKDGEPFATLTPASAVAQKFDGAADPVCIDFAQSAVGSTVLSHLHRDSGLMLLVR